MSEEKPPYAAGARAYPLPEEIICEECENPIGELVQVGHEIWIDLGAVTLFSAHGRCNGCGRDWHYIAGGKELEHLTKRIKKRHRTANEC